MRASWLRILRARSAALLAVSSLMAGAGCGASPPRNTRAEIRGSAPSGSPFLTDVTASSGLDRPNWAWPDGRFFLPEIMGPGVALFDADGDGRLDILQLVDPPPDRSGDASLVHLWRQLSDGRFRDDSQRSGLVDRSLAQGVAIGDVDNDGDLDVYIANYGPDSFYRNNGDGTFAEATAISGITEDGWSSSAAFCDYDRDGWLDLYVAHYLRYDSQGSCTDGGGAREYCGPKGFAGAADTLYRNRGDATFADVTETAGIKLPRGSVGAKGLGVVCADLTADGWPDFLVANDGEPAQLWVNQRNGTFADEAFLRGVAVNRDGHAEAGMGIAVGDVTGEGKPDLYITHLRKENNILLTGDPADRFTDHTAESQLGSYLTYTGFGTGFFDIDLDGDLDIAAVNGRVSRGPLIPGVSLGRFWDRYAEPNVLLENDGTGCFSDIASRGGGFTSEVAISRGLAFGDVDGDGDVDLLVSRIDGSMRLFRNDTPRLGRHWLIVRAMTGSRDALGAEVRLSAGGVQRTRLALAAYSYMSSSDPRVHFGLGASARYESIEVLWPDGRGESFPGGEADRLIVLREGSGRSR